MELERPDVVVPDEWMEAPGGLTAAPGEVQVLHVKLPAVAPAAAWSVLSREERSAAERYRFEIDRNRYVACRAELRRILGACANLPPDRVSFGYGGAGKPFFANGRELRIRFNLSHSGDCALIAVGIGCEVGIDVEKVRADVDHEAVARRFFTANERGFMFALDPMCRATAFYQCWTRKEAWMKAVGTGLCDPLDRYDVSASLASRLT